MKNIKIFALFICIFCFVFCIFNFTSLAQTSDEYYNKAVNKYFLGDNEGAIKDLSESLRLDPDNTKAKDLLQEIRKESGIVAPTTTVAPPPMLAPPATVPAIQKEIEELKKEIKKVTKKEEKPKPEVRPKPEPIIEKKPVEPLKIVVPKVITPKFVPVEGIINQILMLLIAAIIIASFVAVRGAYFVIRDFIREMRQQVCSECKTKNPEKAEFCSLCGTRLRAWSGVTEGQRRWFTKFKWKRNPFTLDVIPQLFTGYAGQVNAVMEKIATRSGHLLVYGDKGVGKTTLLRWLTDKLKKENSYAVYVARPPINFDDMTSYVANEILGKSHWWSRRKKTYTIYELEGMIKRLKKPVVILLDEAHEFTAVIEQQMRTLGDIQGVNYVLAGLPEAREKIKKDSPPFFDRIILEVYLEHLSLQETRDMIKKRIEDAGGKDVKPFTNEAIENIYKMSRGRPRMILKVCDWVMTDAIRNNLDVIAGEMGKDFPGIKFEEEKSAAQKEGKA